jgi:hypothetical protein
MRPLGTLHNRVRICVALGETNDFSPTSCVDLACAPTAPEVRNCRPSVAIPRPGNEIEQAIAEDDARCECDPQRHGGADSKRTRQSSPVKPVGKWFDSQDRPAGANSRSDSHSSRKRRAGLPSTHLPSRTIAISSEDIPSMFRSNSARENIDLAVCPPLPPFRLSAHRRSGVFFLRADRRESPAGS